MCLTLKYLLVISVGLNLGLLFVIFNIWIDHRKEKKLLKLETDEAKNWVTFWQGQHKRIEQKYNSLKDRRRGE
jgi:hypothetical protein